MEEVLTELDSGTDSEFVKNSYMVKLVNKGEMSRQELSETLLMLLMAGVDTTSYVAGWLMINLAQNPDKQQVLREELRLTLAGGAVDAVTSSKLPYLKACIRESHRHTPPSPFTTVRPTKKDLTISGYQVPEGTVCLLHATALTSSLFPEDGQRFVPERWLPEAVAARKGTELEVVDSRLLASPFSAGARMCVGARVANLEIMAIAAQLVQDYKIELEPDQSWGVHQGLFTKADPFPKFRLTPL